MGMPTGVTFKAKRRVTAPVAPSAARASASASASGCSEPVSAAGARLDVIVVEDDDDLRDLLRYNLMRDGFTVRCCERAEESLARIREEPPDLVLLDLMLPGMSGLELCRLLKADERTRRLPVVMLTARGEESDVVSGLELGADDYITKPFSVREVAARARAVLRRSVRAPAAAEEPGVRRVADLVVDPARHEVRVGGAARRLTCTEFRIVEFMARRPGRVYTREQIIRNIQGPSVAVTDRSVDVHVTSLRRKLGPAGGYIETVRGVGYRIREG